MRLSLPGPAAAWVLAAAFTLAGSASPGAETSYPPAPTSWLVDRAGLVSPQAGQALDRRLQALEETHGVRLVIYTDRRLPAGEALEDYTLRSVESWTVWRKQQPALAFFVFSEDRKLRLEVGYGAEAAVTDLESRRILAEVVAPAFRRGDYEGGLRGAVEALGQALAGELPPPKKRAAPRGLNDSFVLFLIVLFVFWLFVLPLLTRRRRSGLGRGGHGPWVLGGPWTGGGGWSGGGGGSVFGGGGGFSGGGGVFGGGGASGDW